MKGRELLKLQEPIDSKEGKLTLLALLMMIYVIALFIAIAIHEVLGHGLFTILLGGDFYAVYISPGSGFASIWFSQAIPAWQMALVYLAGIIVQVSLGLVMLLILYPRIQGFMARLFALVFCACMLVYPSLYLVMGYFYDSGDTRYAVAALGVRPDLFLVAGVMLTGTFILAISMEALKFLGSGMELGSERSKQRALLIFWFPSILLNGIFSLIYSVTQGMDGFAYPFINSLILLMFISLAILLLPIFVDTERKRELAIGMKGVFALALCFVLLLAGWSGAFGLSRENARGLMLADPPVETELYYSDYTVGNVVITVHSNWTARVEVILRNRMEGPSPLEEKIYRSFDTRPDWERHIARSRNMAVTMFELPRGVGENLTFVTEFSTARAPDFQDAHGRNCITWVMLGEMGTRQSYLTPGDQSYQPGMGVPTADITLSLKDPWISQSGFLDTVTLAWAEDLEFAEVTAWNPLAPNLAFQSGSIAARSITWENGAYENAPWLYTLKLNLDA